MNLTADKLTQLHADMEAHRLDRYQIVFNPKIYFGRYAERFAQLTTANQGPFGKIWPLVENELIPEGLIVLVNMEPDPREPLTIVCDLRSELCTTS